MGLLEHTQLRYTLLPPPTAASAPAFQLLQDEAALGMSGKEIQAELCFQWLWDTQPWFRCGSSKIEVQLQQRGKEQVN